jgi:hypothetical protein
VGDANPGWFVTHRDKVSPGTACVQDATASCTDIPDCEIELFRADLAIGAATESLDVNVRIQRDSQWKPHQRQQHIC